MQLLFNASDLTAPTAETLREYASRRFTKLAKYLPRVEFDRAVRISVQKERHTFLVQVEVAVPKVLVVKARNVDLRKAIDMAYQMLKEMLLRYREKVHQRYNPTT